MNLQGGGPTNLIASGYMSIPGPLIWYQLLKQSMAIV